MIVKFFAHRKEGNPQAAMDYLLDKPEGMARVLLGNPRFSQKIAQGLSFKNKYTVGCLSFEERDIPEPQKFELMSAFEDMIFHGLDRDQYNISWIEHTDKGRLELNFFIPNVELTTGKRLYVYYDIADRRLVNSFKRLMNKKYNLTDPDAPEKRQVTIQRYDLPKAKREVLDFLNNYFIEMVSKGLVTNRDEVLSCLDGLGIRIAKVGKDYISIKSDGLNIRLRGAIYEQSFRFEATGEAITGAGGSRASATQGALESEYDAFCRKRTKWNQGRYGKAGRGDGYGPKQSLCPSFFSSSNTLSSDANMGLDYAFSDLCSLHSKNISHIWLILEKLERLFELIWACFLAHTKQIAEKKKVEDALYRQKLLSDRYKEEFQKAELKRKQAIKAEEECKYCVQEEEHGRVESVEKVQDYQEEEEIDDDSFGNDWDSGPSL